MAPEGSSIDFAPGIPLVGMISAFQDLFERAGDRLSVEFGPVRSTCNVFPFTFTDYYKEEMGTGLLRTYVAFGKPAREEGLRRMKSLTTSCEKEFLYPGSARRRINLDPGVLTPEHLVLASHKSAAHRVLLGEGVYAELELIYSLGAFQPLPWTYPDYRAVASLAFFKELRERLLRRDGSGKW